MGKENFNRYSLKNNFMKQVLFRLDYKGVLDIKEIVEVFQEKHKSKFETFETAYHNHVDVELTNINDISDTLSIPVKEIVKQDIYRFTNNTFSDDEVILDISKYFTTLTIKCKNYKTIDLYRDFFAEFIDLLYKVEDYISIKRFGLRKLGGVVLESLDQIPQIFEKEFFNIDFEGNNFTSVKNNYVDILEKSEPKTPTINYRRSFEKGKLLNEDGSETVAYQVLLDFDGFLDEQKLIDSELVKTKNISTIIDMTNDCLFEIFKMSVTEEFLSKSSK